MANQGRVLVVEDHETERRALSTLLKAEGFTVFGAENADKALGYIDENIDVVLTDLHMGDVSGIDLLTLQETQGRITVHSGHRRAGAEQHRRCDAQWRI
jgi:DNA-binding NtrC family response regulator